MSIFKRTKKEYIAGSGMEEPLSDKQIETENKVAEKVATSMLLEEKYIRMQNNWEEMMADKMCMPPQDYVKKYLPQMLCFLNSEDNPDRVQCSISLKLTHLGKSVTYMRTNSKANEKFRASLTKEELEYWDANYNSDGNLKEFKQQRIKSIGANVQKFTDSTAEQIASNPKLKRLTNSVKKKGDKFQKKIEELDRLDEKQ